MFIQLMRRAAFKVVPVHVRIDAIVSVGLDFHQNTRIETNHGDFTVVETLDEVMQAIAKNRGMWTSKELMIRLSWRYKGGDCDHRGMADPETGEVPCGLEDSGGDCTCAKINEFIDELKKEFA